MKAVAIVGAGPGIGAAVARRFAREGFALALIARSADKLQALQRDLEQTGATVQTCAADAGDFAELSGALERVKTELGAPEVLVYNARSSSGQGVVGLQTATLELDFRVNASGALVATQAVLPAMLAAGRGTVLLTGGGLALRPVAQSASLSVGKAGLRSLALSLFQELGPQGIHVATVTVAGFVQPGTAFDPDGIADHYWRLHMQPQGAWEAEFVYDGQTN